MRKAVLVLFFLLFCSQALASLDVNVSNEPFSFGAGKQNTFYYTISCSSADHYLQQGDLINAKFFGCSNRFCEEAFSSNFVFQVPCIQQGSFDYFVPVTANDEIVESVEIVFMGKKSTDVSFPLRQTFSFGGAFLSEPTLSFPAFVPLLQVDYSFYLLLLGVILIVASLVLIKFGHWSALLFLIAGLILIVLNVFR